MSIAVAEPAARRPLLSARVLSVLFTAAIGTFLALNPVTSVVLLGWLTALMRRRALAVLNGPSRAPGRLTWITNPGGHSRLDRWVGGLVRNVGTGAQAALSLFVAVLPFGALWLVSWWAGWENSFNKGYEQAFVGPTLGVGGIAVFAITMVYLPVALVHQAVEQRTFAFFEFRRVLRIIAHTGWEYAAWALATFVLALPILASRGLPAFGEGFYPPLADMSPQQVEQVRNVIDLITAFYIFATLVFLKRWSAGLYARALARSTKPRHGMLRRTGRLLRFPVLVAVWTGLAFQIFIGQFLNHDWHFWLTHPYVFLPWTG